jgi:signal peptidase II
MAEQKPVPWRAAYAWIVAIVVALDQLVKFFVDKAMAPHDTRVIVEGFARLTYVRNRGAAFGILSDADLPYQSVLFTVVSLAALSLIALYAWKLPAPSRLPRVALAFIVGGAIGNLVDRVRLGYVIDFVDVYWGTYHWPAFNVADSAITCGVILLLLDILRSPEDQPAPAAMRPGPGAPAATGLGTGAE